MIIEKLAFMPVRARKVPFARTRGKDIFYNLGGKREKGESDTDALIRELKEEANVALLLPTLRLVRAFTGPCHGYPEGTILEMKCFDGEFEGVLTPSGEVEEIVWFTSADLHRTTDMGKTILEWYKAERLID